MESSQLTDLLTVQSIFTNALIQRPDAADAGPSEAQMKLSTLFSDSMAEIKEVTEDHWKNPAFPLQRIKKIMKMDEDVQMISGEVPILLSKAIELFVSELSLRSWINTEENKRRTLQRNDIAVAVAKNDMFDFLIDIVPREEIQQKPRFSKDSVSGVSDQPTTSVPPPSSSSSSSSGISPELLQAYLQLLSQQYTYTSAGEGEDSSDGQDTTTANLMQQMTLLQQLIQLQRGEQDSTSLSEQTASTEESGLSSLAHPLTEVDILTSSSLTVDPPTSTTTGTSATATTTLPQFNELTPLGTGGTQRVIIGPKGIVTEHHQPSQH